MVAEDLNRQGMTQSAKGPQAEPSKFVLSSAHENWVLRIDTGWCNQTMSSIKPITIHPNGIILERAALSLAANHRVSLASATRGFPLPCMILILRMPSMVTASAPL